jgi:DMATS type aromatic prenyltransferase
MPVQHSKHLEFLSEWIIPLLGPKSRSINGKDVPVFKSYMCEDNTPIELSLAWNPDTSKPTVRFSIEPLPTNEQANVSQIVAYGLLVIDSLHQSFQVSVSAFADHFILDASLFRDILKTIGYSNDQEGPTIISNIFLGFDLLPSRVQTKAYCVLSSSMDPMDRLALIFKVISAHTPNSDAGSTMMAYFQSKTQDWYSTYSPDPRMIGVDCTGSRNARVKIYIRYQFTDFDHMVDQFSLGGRIPISLACVASLRDLWYRFVGKDCDPFLRPSVDDTSGILFYYEYNNTKSLPSPKINLPVRIMAKNDQAITSITAEWLGSNSHFSEHKASFLTTVSETWYGNTLCFVEYLPDDLPGMTES